jgi:N-acetylmuramoyl-L-alanine amidase
VLRLVIDPGHGGHDPGAVCGGLREADLTLALALELAHALRGYAVDLRLTREDDREVPLAARVALANELTADLYLSIHCNAAQNPESRGFESYVHPAARPCTQAFRSLIHAAAASYLAQHGVPDRGQRRADFYVLRRTACPAVLLECLFITNAADAALLRDPCVRAGLARTLARAVARATGLAD